jgi:rubrerythrin
MEVDGMAGTDLGLNIGDYGVEDMYQVAVLIEQGGYDFYSRIAEQSDNPQVKNEVTSLMEEEARHKDFFTQQLTARGGDPGFELNQELRGWMDREFVNPMEEALSSQQPQSNRQALQLGIALEQKTIDLYESLKAQSSDSKTQEDLQAIIDEEYAHKRRLNVLLAY